MLANFARSFQAVFAAKLLPYNNIRSVIARGC